MMLEVAQRITLRATQAGPIAHAALRAGARGAVHSVFERSAYVALDGALVCIGPPGFGAGPLNLLSQPWPHRPSLSDVLRVDHPVVVQGGMLQVGDAITIAVEALERWKPAPAPVWSRASLRRGLTAVGEAWRGGLPTEGLAALLGDAEVQSTKAVIAAAIGPGNYIAALAHDAEQRPSISQARHPEVLDHRSRVYPRSAIQNAQVGNSRLAWSSLEGRSAGAVRPSRPASRAPQDDGVGEARQLVDAQRLLPLLGLGPGLTPSGDDFLGGTFVAFTLIGRASLRDAIWQAIEPAVRASTTEISGAHLSAAAQGFGSAALHDVLNAVLAGDTAAIPARLRTVAAIGHTSGWDALAGAMTVLRAVAGGSARP